jgi:hypothetical protein
MSENEATALENIENAAKPTAKAKKSTKKAKKALKASANGKPDRSMSDTPPGERKTALIKALRKVGATKLTAAVSITDLATKLGYTHFDVYGLVAGTSGKVGSNPNCLLATGHVKVNEEKAVYLTPKGAKTDFSGSPFVRATKAE